MRMVPRIDTRMYTNLILTGIAVLMLAMVAQDYRVGVVGAAHAQTQSADTVVRRNVPDLERTDTGVIIDSQIPQTQDVAVARATSDVALANREIAAALLELATAVREAGNSIRANAASAAPAATNAAGTATPAAAAERPVIEVAP